MGNCGNGCASSDETKTEVKKKTKLAIVGCASSRNDTPWHDDSFEFWGVNNLYLSEPVGVRPWSRWFEIHEITKDEQGKHYRRGAPEFRGQPVGDYLKGLGSLGIPVYMQHKWDEVPNGVEFPINDVLNKFGNYLTNSISYQLALAIMEGFKEIHLYGVDMAVSSPFDTSNEYAWQRPSCEFFLGLAAGMGIKIFIPETSDLLKSRFLYAYDEPKMSAWDKKVDDTLAGIQKQRLKAERMLSDAQRKLDQCIGADIAIREINKTWQSGDSGYVEVRKANQQNIQKPTVCQRP
jgi:hypothetical protein